MHGFGYCLIGYTSLNECGKSLSAGPCKVSSMSLTINPKCLIAPLAPGNMIYLRFSRVTVGAGHHLEGAGVQKRYENAKQTHVS